METIDWSKAPEGYPVWLEFLPKALEADHERRRTGGEWVKDCGDRFETMRGTFWTKPEEGFYRVYQRPTTQPAWSGKGCPPAGVLCEAKSMARGVERDWFSATVLYSSPYTVVLDDYQAGEFVAHPATMQFRPIRTPEQIAAEEREAAVAAMVAVLGVSGSRDTYIMQRLYDAGYRKP